MSVIKRVLSDLGGKAENVLPAPDRLREALRNADRTMPASNIERFPIEARLSALERANSNVAVAEAAVERCQLHLEECEKQYQTALSDRTKAQQELFLNLAKCGAFEGIKDVQAFIRQCCIDDNVRRVADE